MKVQSLQKVKTDRYKEGELFFTDKEVGILINGKIKKLNTTSPNMAQYVKKSEVEKMIDDKLKELKELDYFEKQEISRPSRPYTDRDFNSRITRYNDDSDYTTNAPSYYDDLARKNQLLKTLSYRIWEYQEVINKQFNEWDEEIRQRFLEWDKNLEEFDDEVLRLLQEWMEDGTLDHIINETIFNWKADKKDLVELDNRLTSEFNSFKNNINKNINSLNDRYDDHINNYNAFRGEIINIREYDDLNGDGQLFDTAIIQHAVDNYKVVLIPESDSYYKIDKQINVPSEAHIIGLGLPKIYN